MHARKEIKSLKVIEIWMKTDSTRTTSLSKALLKATNAFRPESCMRQVYIFRDIHHPEFFNQAYTNMKENARKCNYFTGFDAYRFLLSWIVGGEYREPKPNCTLPLYNDHHILGRFISEWAGGKSKFKENYSKIVTMLLEDAHHIRKNVESGIYGKADELRATLDVVINNIIFSRSQGFPVVCDALDKEHEVYLTAIKNTLSKTTAQLQQLLTVKQAAASNNNELVKTIFCKLLSSCVQQRLLKIIMDNAKAHPESSKTIAKCTINA